MLLNSMIAKATQSQSEPPVVMLRFAFGGLVSRELPAIARERSDNKATGLEDAAGDTVLQFLFLLL